jgi:hypothetical protein
MKPLVGISSIFRKLFLALISIGKIITNQNLKIHNYLYNSNLFIINENSEYFFRKYLYLS